MVWEVVRGSDTALLRGVLELRTNQGLLFAEHPTPSSKVSESLCGVV